ncbi:SIR2 family NAD-dependent protein deacylase [Hydrogenophaga sp. T2]|uniref:SIR2 family NAD-dependent protein deacylase n=1 Tax=Hydrogenophaga sp. T2 TaxID=3132823 RepID=UPI003CF7C6D0
MPDLPPADIHKAADLIAQADGLIVAAGAGMGVDSGLPDFRGPEGFWNAYPALGRAGLGFTDIANPAAFARHPELAWGFYGHRLAMYRRVRPHAGFALLRRWGEATLHGLAVFTSNVDGQFQAAGFNAALIEECHGSLHHLQCTRPCSDTVWPADGFEPEVDAARCELLNAPPRCPRCGALARPNVLMFGDAQWLAQRQADQRDRLVHWLAHCERPLVIEIGAGTAVPTVRHFSHAVIRSHAGRLLRVNPLAPAVPGSLDVGLAGPALATLEAIDRQLP